MKPQGLIVAVLVLAALTGALYWSNRHQTVEDAGGGMVITRAKDAPPQILSVKRDDIEELDIKKRGQDELQLKKDATGQWQITAPKPYPASSDTVRDMLVSLSSIDSERVIDDKATDLGTFGLADPAVIEVDLIEKDNKTHRLLLGDETPTGSTIYAVLVGDPRLFGVSSYIKTTANKTLNELRDQRLMRIDAAQLNRVELTAKNQTIEFVKNANGWQIEKPKPQRADAARVEVLLNQLTDAKFDPASADDQKGNAAAFASGAPWAIAKMTAGSATQELQVRKNKEDYYAKSSGVDGVYKVSGDLGAAVSKGVDDFQDLQLAEFNPGDPEDAQPTDVDKIELHDGSKAYFLTRNGDEWWSNGTKMDTVSVQALLQAIHNLSATKLVDSGFTQPVIELTVTSKGGKLVQKASISKSGDGYIAKREDGPSLLLLEARAVEEVQTAASKVVPLASRK